MYVRIELQVWNLKRLRRPRIFASCDIVSSSSNHNTSKNLVAYQNENRLRHEIALLLESKHRDYLLTDFGEETRAEMLDEIKVLFMDYLKQGLKRFEMDPLNTLTSVHVTGSETQSTSKKWKRERFFKYDFLNPHYIKILLVPFSSKVTCSFHLFI